MGGGGSAIYKSPCQTRTNVIQYYGLIPIDWWENYRELLRIKISKDHEIKKIVECYSILHPSDLA